MKIIEKEIDLTEKVTVELSKYELYILFRIYGASSPIEYKDELNSNVNRGLKVNFDFNSLSDEFHREQTKTTWQEMKNYFVEEGILNDREE